MVLGRIGRGREGSPVRCHGCLRDSSRAPSSQLSRPMTNAPLRPWLAAPVFVGIAALPAPVLTPSPAPSSFALPPSCSSPCSPRHRVRALAIAPPRLRRSFRALVFPQGVVRMATVGAKSDVLLAAGGDYSDFQQMLKIISASAVEEYTMDDGATMSASAMHHWLTRIMYQRRSKIDPLWNTIVIAGVKDGQSYLGTTDLYGTMYTDDFIVRTPPPLRTTRCPCLPTRVKGAHPKSSLVPHDLTPSPALVSLPSPPSLSPPLFSLSPAPFYPTRRPVSAPTSRCRCCARRGSRT